MKRQTAPKIISQPSSVTVVAPSSAQFTVVATGNPAPTYQWRRNGQAIVGATTATYTVTATTQADSGTKFTVVVTNSLGSVTSKAATLTVSAPPVNTPPVAADDAYSVTRGGTLNLTGAAAQGVLGNDVDVDGQPLTAALVSGVVNGTLALNADGTFTYVHSGTGNLSQALSPGAANSLVEYGVASAIDGNTLVIGSNSAEGGLSLSGAAYVFVREGLAWQLQAKLLPPDPVAIHFFGWAVDVSGDTIVVGAPGDNHAGQYSGAAYVFVRNGTTWTLQAKIVASDARARDEFGTSVAIQDNTMVIGANYHDDGATDAGAAYVFVRTGGTAWTQQAELRASDPSTQAMFGVSVALDGDTAVAGAFNDDELGSNAGAAYAFRRSGTSWAQEGKLLASNGSPNANFGFSVATEGERIVVGAFNYLDDAGAYPGGAYVFGRTGATWTETQRLPAPDVASVGFLGFGVSVSLQNSTIVVGAHGDDEAGNDAGAAYVFGLNGSIWEQRRKLFAPTPVAGAEFGVTVAVAGDYAAVGANSAKFTVDYAQGSAAAYQVGGDLNDSFTYVAHDGAASSNTATVRITITQP